MAGEGSVFDVIVVGAGIQGSSTAYQLAKMRKQVLLLEQFPLPHSWGSSHGQTRTTRRAYGSQEFYTLMMEEAFRLLHELETETDEILFKNCGCLFVGPPSNDFIQSTPQILKRHNIAYEILSTDARKKKFPSISAPNELAFITDESGGMLMAHKVLLAYHKRLKEMGGTLRDGEPMKDLIPGQVITVTTNKGRYRAHSVVLALGPWAAKFLPRIGLNLPLKPIHIGVYYWREKTPGEFSQFPTFFEAEACGKFDVYGMPCLAHPGFFKLCLHAGPAIDPDQRDHVDKEWVTEALKAYIARRFPTLEPESSIVESCIYTNTPDEDFIIDTHPKWKNIVIGAGFSGHGFKLAPVVGKVLAELALGQKPSCDLTPFKMARFTKHKL